MDKNTIIAIGILALVGTGLFFFFTMTGAAITGSAISSDMAVKEEYFRINEPCSFSCADDSKINDKDGGELDG